MTQIKDYTSAELQEQEGQVCEEHYQQRLQLANLQMKAENDRHTAKIQKRMREQFQIEKDLHASKSALEDQTNLPSKQDVDRELEEHFRKTKLKYDAKLKEIKEEHRRIMKSGEIQQDTNSLRQKETQRITEFYKEKLIAVQTNLDKSVSHKKMIKEVSKKPISKAYKQKLVIEKSKLELEHNHRLEEITNQC